MGRYMRKAKITNDVAVMEVAQSAGVLTRAKTLALQRQQSAASDASDALSYLQLRSRRLRKVSFLEPNPAQKHDPEEKSNCMENAEAGPPSPVSTLGLSDSVNPDFVGPASGSFGENEFDSEARGRFTRESTPASLIGNVDMVMPGSSTRQRSLNATNYTSHNAFRIPSVQEMRDFFKREEQQSQREFMEKYNFDFVADVPLPGRYEWVRMQQ